MQTLTTRLARRWPILLLFCCFGSARAWAEGEPAAEARLAWAGTLPAVEVDVEAPAGLEGCPNAETIAARTNAYVGWDFARGPQPARSDTRPPGARVRLVFEASPRAKRVDVRLFQPDDSAPTGVSLRVHEVEESCDELGRMAALTVSLLAQSPTPTATAASAGAVASVTTAPSSPPTPEPVAPEKTGLEPVAPKPEPTAAAATASDVPTAEQADVPASGFEVGGAALVGYGFVPGWSGGGGLFGAYRSGKFSLRLSGSFQAGPGETVPSSGAAYSGFGGTGDLSGCYAPWPRSHVCVLAGVLWLVASGSDFDENRQGLGTSPLLGLGLAQRFAAGSRVEWGVRLEGAVPLAPVELLLQGADGEQERLWQMAPVIVRLGLELAFR